MVASTRIATSPKAELEATSDSRLARPFERQETNGGINQDRYEPQSRALRRPPTHDWLDRLNDGRPMVASTRIATSPKAEL